MQCFKDSTGQAWDINITLDTRDLIRARCGFDFVAESSAGFGALIESVVCNLEKFVALLFVILEEQREERKMSPKELSKRLDGTAINNAQTATEAAFYDFFLQTRKCHLATALREAMTNFEALLAKAEQESAANSQLVKTLIDTSGNLQELSESFPVAKG